MDNRIKFSRRTFLKGALLASVMGVPSIIKAETINAPAKADVQGERMALAMWDFSYMTRRYGEEAEYANVDSVLDGFVQRGYNCVRIDAFPHLIASDQTGKIEQEFIQLPQKKTFMWGNHSEVAIHPRRDLIDFMSKCESRGIRVGLSSWFQNVSSNRTAMVTTPQEMARVWQETLEWIGEHQLLDIVEWVDICNEFPLNRWAPGAVAYMNQKLCPPLTELYGIVAPYTRKQGEAISRYMYDVLNSLKPRFPQLKFCFSSGASIPSRYQYVDFSPFDCLEPHIWLNSNFGFMVSTGLAAVLLEVPGATWCASNACNRLYKKNRARYLNWMAEIMDGWVAIANRLQVPLYTSEAWGPINYEDLPASVNDREWEWVFDICEACVDMARERGWTGICASNFSQPHHIGFYNDVAYHQRITDRILNT